jgi:rod shape-determining protein MreD
MTAWLSIPVLAAMVALQVALVPSLDIEQARPQLVLIWVVCWAVVRGRGEALPWAIVGGLLLDLLSQLPPGSHLLALSLVAFLADLGHRVMRGNTWLFAAASVVLASLVYDYFLLAILAVTGHRLDLSGAMGTLVLPSAAYNLVLMVPLLAILKAVDQRFPVPIGPEW